MKNPHNNPIWQEVANSLKPLLRAVDGEVGIFLIEKKGSVAAIVLGREEAVNPDHLKKSLELFRKRLKEMGGHVNSGELNFDSNSQTFVRDSETGKYNPVPPPTQGNENN